MSSESGAPKAEAQPVAQPLAVTVAEGVVTPPNAPEESANTKPAPAPTTEPTIPAADPHPVTTPPPVSTETKAVPAAETTAPATAPPAANPTEKKDPAAADEKPAPAEVAEPENPLTRKFTQAERNALKDFRGELPEIYKQAYEDAADKTDGVIHLWGVDIDTKNPLASGARASVVLMKFLRARNLSITDSRSMMIATLRWRETFNIPAVMKEEYPQDVFGKLGYIYGKDKEGRPVTYNLYGANKDTKSVFGDVQRFLRWRVKLMEESLTLLDFETIDQTVQVHDYGGVSIFAGRDANAKNAAAETTSVFSNHYPELLYKKFFVNAPSLLSWMFWLFKPLLPAKTLAKMTVVGTGTDAISQALLPVIDTKELPKRYGGQAETTW